MREIKENKKENFIDKGNRPSKENGNEVRNAIFEYEKKLVKNENYFSK